MRLLAALDERPLLARLREIDESQREPGTGLVAIAALAERELDAERRQLAAQRIGIGRRCL